MKIGKLPTERLSSGQKTERLKWKSVVITLFSSTTPRIVLKFLRSEALTMFHVLVPHRAFFVDNSLSRQLMLWMFMLVYYDFCCIFFSFTISTAKRLSLFYLSFALFFIRALSKKLLCLAYFLISLCWCCVFFARRSLFICLNGKCCFSSFSWQKIYT